jgi:Integrase core domain
VRSPQTDGICERFHRTIKQEFYDLAFRKKIYTSLESLQSDVDEWLKKYNEFRPHSGRYCYGKTPMQTFLDAKHLAKEHQLDTLYKNLEEEKIESLRSETFASTMKHHEVNRTEIVEINKKGFDLSDRQLS